MPLNGREGGDEGGGCGTEGVKKGNMQTVLEHAHVSRAAHRKV